MMQHTRTVPIPSTKHQHNYLVSGIWQKPIHSILIFCTAWIMLTVLILVKTPAIQSQPQHTAVSISKTGRFPYTQVSMLRISVTCRSFRPMHHSEPSSLFLHARVSGVLSAMLKTLQPSHNSIGHSWATPI